MRYDRVASVHLIHPVLRISNRLGRTGVPIFMYHSISDGARSRDSYFETNTSPKIFAQQMQFLYKNGYSAVSLTEALKTCFARETDRKHVVITFDDGYHDFYTEAYPILRQYGFTATIFLISGHIGRYERLRFDERECLIQSEVQELHNNGISIGSHTMTHPKLRFLSSSRIDYEVSQSKESIEDAIGDSVKSFSYPFAFPEEDRPFANDLAVILEKRGYENGVSTIIGTAKFDSHRFFLPRLPLNSGDDIPFFKAKLEGGYDWAHKAQYLVKRAVRSAAIETGKAEEKEVLIGGPANHPKDTRYVAITPARDEAEHIECTIRSMLEQSIKPIEWVIVDDGSTDGTAAIVDRYAEEYAWIRPIHRANRGFRKPAIGVMEAFYQGYESLRATDWEFIVKLDGDLSFAPDYFERCFDRFSEDPRLGIGGGIIHYLFNGAKETEVCGPPFHVRGATKIYRRACWNSIDGLIKAPGWDTIDELKANMLGWQTRSFPDVELRQHRATGAADGAWRNSLKDGRADYVSGYHPLFMLLKCLKRTMEKPYVIGAVGLLYGFLSGYIEKAPQVNDKALIGYVRSQQMRRIFFLDSIPK